MRGAAGERCEYMRIAKWSIRLAALAGLLLWTSCIMLDLPWNMEGGYQAEFHRIVKLQEGGAIELDNPSGNVEIRGWNEDKVEVTARQVGTSPGGLSRWGFRTEPRVSVESDGQSVAIETVQVKESEFQPEIQFLVYVPQSVNLKDIRVGRGSLIVGDAYGSLAATVDDGDLVIENYSGSVRASVRQGHIEAELLDLRSGDQVDLTVDKGDLTLFLEPEAGVKLTAEAPRGEISGDFDLKATPPAQSVSVELGDGRATVVLKALDGDIQVKKNE
jgi:hypothetical protein